MSAEASVELVTVQSSNSHVPPTAKPAVIDSYMNSVDMADHFIFFFEQ